MYLELHNNFFLTIFQYEIAALILSSNDAPVILAKVDANEEKNKDLATEYDINSFPKLKIIRDRGKTVEDYKGPRDAQGIVSYLKKQTGPASVEIKSTEDGNTLIDGDKIVIVSLCLLPFCILYMYVLLFRGANFNPFT